MGFETAMAIAALVGVGMIVVGALLLGLFPNFDGFGSAVGVATLTAGGTGVITIIGKVIGAFLKIVKDILTGKAGEFHIGQIFIAIGFLLFLVCGAIWLGAQVGDSNSSSNTPTTPTTTTSAQVRSSAGAARLTLVVL